MLPVLCHVSLPELVALAPTRGFPPPLQLGIAAPPAKVPAPCTTPCFDSGSSLFRTPVGGMGAQSGIIIRKHTAENRDYTIDQSHDVYLCPFKETPPKQSLSREEQSNKRGTSAKLWCQHGTRSPGNWPKKSLNARHSLP